MTCQARAQALLALIERDRTARCAAILDAARDAARALVAEAHRRARERIRIAYAEERDRRGARVAAAQAELSTRLRAAGQQRSRALLARAWTRLPVVLEWRWLDHEPRERWIADAITHALRVLPAGVWRIEHAPGLTENEKTTLAGKLRTNAIHVSFSEIDSLRAGLRVIAGSTMIDNTLDGMLSDREEIGARLLALIENRS